MERKRIYIISHYNPDTNARYIDGAALTEEQAVILADRAADGFIYTGYNVLRVQNITQEQRTNAGTPEVIRAYFLRERETGERLTIEVYETLEGDTSQY